MKQAEIRALSRHRKTSTPAEGKAADLN